MAETFCGIISFPEVGIADGMRGKVKRLLVTVA
jgi:hypothetical protein